MNKHNHGLYGRRILSLVMTVLIAVTCIPAVGAVTQSEVDKMKEKQKELKGQMSQLQDEIDSLQQQQNTALDQVLVYQKQMDALSVEINTTQDNIADYETRIAETQVELEEAQKKSDEYYQLFCERVRDMEEAGNLSYWSILFESANFSDLLDRLSFVHSVATYDNDVVTQLEEARKEVAETEARLNEEKAALDVALGQLEDQMEDVEEAEQRTQELLTEIAANQATYEDQLTELEGDSEDLEADIVSGEAELEAERQRLEELKRQEEEKRRQEEERRKQEEEKRKEEAANKPSNGGSSSGGSTSGGGSIKPPAPSGSGLGVDIANYACTFVGKLPYVWGGTSLTSGADCSGFVQAVFKQFGIYLPRTSQEQARCGTAVSYSEARPGDLIFYYTSSSMSGSHIGIYIGNGKYVNAAGKKWGTVISNVNPNRTGLTFRRVV